MNITSFSFKKYIAAFLLAFIITIFAQALLSVVFSFLPPPQWLLGAVHGYMVFFSAFLAAFFCARAGSRRGLVTGMAAADTYMLILLFAGIILFKNEAVFSQLIKTFSIASVVGAAGGILGINFK